MKTQKFIKFRLIIDTNLVKTGTPHELLKTLIIVPLESQTASIKQVQDLLKVTYQQIKFMIDESKVDKNLLLLATSDGFMLPPFTPVSRLFTENCGTVENGE